MKTLIVGTGVIGTIYGWALSESGADITHLVRKGRRQEYLKIKLFFNINFSSILDI